MKTPPVLPILRTSALLLASILAPILAQAEFIGKVVGVIDGDSIRVMHEGQAEQIRLLGVDCPEKRQPFGTRAKEFTSELAFGQDVTVYGEKRDRYGRRLAEILLPDGRSLNQELIKAGLAWWFRKYSKDLRMGELERQARAEKRGYGQSRTPCRRGSGGPLQHDTELWLPPRLNYTRSFEPQRSKPSTQGFDYLWDQNSLYGTMEFVNRSPKLVAVSIWEPWDQMSRITCGKVMPA